MANSISVQNSEIIHVLGIPQRLKQRPLLRLCRYGMSLAGPMSVSAIHFGASILTFHALGASDFGLFCFAIVITSLSLSVMVALVAAPMMVLTAVPERNEEMKILCSANAICSVIAGILCTGLLIAVGAPVLLGALFGLYGTLMCIRAVARAYSYIHNDAFEVTIADSIYALVLAAGFSTLWVVRHQITITNIALVMMVGAFISLVFSNGAFLSIQLQAVVRPKLRPYKIMWRHTTRWSFLGVLTSELSANAHAYVVTLFAGTGAFGLLSIGSILMRPLNLIMKTLADVELRSMKGHLGGGDGAAAILLVKRLDYAGVVLWTATAAAVVAIFRFTPGLLVKGTYSEFDVGVVASIWLAIAFARITRNSRSVLLQVSGEFKPLAKVGILASLTSLILTGALLASFGPMYSLFGVLLSEVLLTRSVHRLTRLGTQPPMHRTSHSNCASGRNSGFAFRRVFAKS